MRKKFFVIIVFVMLFIPALSFGQDRETYGITIDQSSLEILTIASQVFNNARFSNDYDQAISIKAKVIISDVIMPNIVPIDLSDMIFNARMEIIKTKPDIVRLNLTSNLGDIQFLRSGAESFAVLPQDNLYAKTYFPEILPANLIFPSDNGGLFTLLNIFGGIPLGSFFVGSPVGGGQSIDYVDQLSPSDIKAIIRYRGMDKTAGGLAHIITVGSAVYRQYIKIWILKDTLLPYQLSIEDERGTEIFVIFEELDASTMPACATITIDTTGMNEVSQNELIGMFLMKASLAPLIEDPFVADFFISNDPIARTGTVTISSDGFDMQDREDKLICEIQYKSPSGSWIPLPTEYAGLAPVGRWNADFTVPRDAELGKYSFRVRFIDSSLNASEWAKYMDILTVTPEPPRIVMVTPRDKSTNVPTSTKISVSFSKAMNKDSVERSFNMVAQKSGIIKGSFSWEENTMIFTPNRELDYNTRYLLVVSGRSKDTENIGLDGNYNAISEGEYYDDFVWEFTTGEAVPTLAFAPINRSIYVGDIIDVRVVIKNVVDLYKFSFIFKFDPNFFEIMGFQKLSFISWSPASSLAKDSDLWKNVVVNNKAGFATFECNATRKGGVSGSGYLATLTLKCKSAGKSTISFSNATAYTSDNTFISIVPQGTDIKAIELHPYDTNCDGVVDIRDLIEEAKSAPAITKSSLNQNYPNPFNPETWIPYQLAESTDVNIKIYNLNGELVRTLDLGYKTAGFYTDKTKSAYWDGMDENGQKVSSGIYFYTIKAGNFLATKKMIVRK